MTQSLEMHGCWTYHLLMALSFWLKSKGSIPQGLKQESGSLPFRVYIPIAAKSLQSCPTLCNPMDCSLPGFSVHGILQARTLEWVAISLLQCMKVESESEVTQSCLTLSDPMDCSPPGSSIQGTFWAIVLEWGAIAFSHSPIRSYEKDKTWRRKSEHGNCSSFRGKGKHFISLEMEEAGAWPGCYPVNTITPFVAWHSKSKLATCWLHRSKQRPRQRDVLYKTPMGYESSHIY